MKGSVGQQVDTYLIHLAIQISWAGQKKKLGLEIAGEKEEEEKKNIVWNDRGLTKSQEQEREEVRHPIENLKIQSLKIPKLIEECYEARKIRSTDFKAPYHCQMFGQAGKQLRASPKVEKQQHQQTPDRTF